MKFIKSITDELQSPTKYTEKQIWREVQITMCELYWTKKLVIAEEYQKDFQEALMKELIKY
jgi:hypothetical protein